MSTKPSGYKSIFKKLYFNDETLEVTNNPMFKGEFKILIRSTRLDAIANNNYMRVGMKVAFLRLLENTKHPNEIFHIYSCVSKKLQMVHLYSIVFYWAVEKLFLPYVSDGNKSFKLFKRIFQNFCNNYHSDIKVINRALRAVEKNYNGEVDCDMDEDNGIATFMRDFMVQAAGLISVPVSQRSQMVDELLERNIKNFNQNLDADSYDDIQSDQLDDDDDDSGDAEDSDDNVPTKPITRATSSMASRTPAVVRPTGTSQAAPLQRVKRYLPTRQTIVSAEVHVPATSSATPSVYPAPGVSATPTTSTAPPVNSAPGVSAVPNTPITPITSDVISDVTDMGTTEHPTEHPTEQSDTTQIVTLLNDLKINAPELETKVDFISSIVTSVVGKAPHQHQHQQQLQELQQQLEATHISSPQPNGSHQEPDNNAVPPTNLGTISSPVTIPMGNNSPSPSVDEAQSDENTDLTTYPSTPDTAPDTDNTTDSTTDTTADTTDTTPDTIQTTDTTLDTDTDNAADITPDITPDTTLDTTPDTAVDTPVDTAVDPTPDTAPDTGVDRESLVSETLDTLAETLESNTETKVSDHVAKLKVDIVVAALPQRDSASDPTATSNITKTTNNPPEKTTIATARDIDRDSTAAAAKTIKELFTTSHKKGVANDVLLMDQLSSHNYNLGVFASARTKKREDTIAEFGRFHPYKKIKFASTVDTVPS